MASPVIRNMRISEAQLLRDFCAAHWGGRHALLFDEKLFTYYYCGEDSLQFAGAFDGDELCGVCGYIACNGEAAPDIWLSFILTRPGAPLALSLRIVEFITEETKCRTIACNNIRPKTRGIYEFMGYTFAGMQQYYRLNNNKPQTIATIVRGELISPRDAGCAYRRFKNADEMRRAFPAHEFAACAPYKDITYLERRYFHNPYLRYEVIGVDQGDCCRAIIVYRVITYGSSRMLRIVDFVGDRTLLGTIGKYIDEALVETDAEYADFYCYGPSEEELRSAGFTRRNADDGNILPFYLEPPEHKNVDIYLFTSRADGYWMFRADGDQDRANLESRPRP